MKIGLVSPYDWSYPGGVRDHIRNLAEQFIRQGYEVRILAPISGRQSRMPEKYFYPMGWATPIPFNGSIARITCDPALPLRLRSVLQQERFDVLHIHEPLVPELSLAVLHYSRTLTVGTFHAYAPSRMSSIPYLTYVSASGLLRPYFRRLNGHIAVSTAAEQFASHTFPANYRVIPNGVNLERFNPHVVPWPHLMDGKQNILFLGRFEKRKGADYLVRALPTIRKQHPDTRFLFVGEGSYRRRLQHIVQQQAWRDVLFTGAVSDADVPRYFASAHIFCAPAIGSESMGIVLLEAMASGAPIVASNIPGYASVVTSGSDGLLTTPCNSQELAGAINLLLANEHHRQQLIYAGLQKVREYDWSDIACSMLDYYSQILSGHSIGLSSA